MSETCYQCGKQEDKLPIIAIMAFEPEEAMKSLSANRERTWMAMGVCNDCHQHPRLKCHFFYRNQMHIALDKAGSSDIGG